MGSRGWLFLVLGIVLLGSVFVSSVAYTVNEAQHAVVLEFGKPVLARSEPGLYFKWPVVHSIRYLPKTLLFSETEQLGDLPTADGKKIEVSPWAIWRISDPLVFVQVLQTPQNASGRVETFVRAAVRDVITKHPLAETVRSSKRELSFSLRSQGRQLPDGTPAKPAEEGFVAEIPGEDVEPIQYGRDRIVAEIEKKLKDRLQQVEGGSGERRLDRGIQLVAVGISRLDFVPAVREAAFERQIATMRLIANKNLAEGEQRRKEILNQTSAEVQRIEGEGQRKANTLRGDVDAKIIREYAEAIQETGEFYNFIRTLEVFKNSLYGDTRLILTTDNQLFRLMNGADGRKPALVPVDPLSAPPR